MKLTTPLKTDMLPWGLEVRPPNSSVENEDMMCRGHQLGVNAEGLLYHVLYNSQGMVCIRAMEGEDQVVSGCTFNLNGNKSISG